MLDTTRIDDDVYVIMSPIPAKFVYYLDSCIWNDLEISDSLFCKLVEKIISRKDTHLRTIEFQILTVADWGEAGWWRKMGSNFL